MRPQTHLDASALISAIPTSYATCSIGASSTPLETKLRAISSAGFNAIELAFPDLVSYASQLAGNQVSELAYPTLCDYASKLRLLCDSLNLRVLMLQPFANFEGWSKDSPEYKDAWDRARGWRDVMVAVGTDMLQVGSSDAEGISGDVDWLAGDLRELGEFLGEKGFKVAYENWCWATHAPGWKEVWDIVKRVDRENVGLCLDTFQTAGGEWGDPTTGSGRLEGLSQDELERRYESSMKELTETVPRERIFLLQISDAHKTPEPFSKDKDESGLRPRGRWSHDFRPMPFDGGYLPIVPMTRAVLKTGFTGWFSMEIFDGGKDGKGRDTGDLDEYAKKAMESHKRLIQEATK